LCLVLNFKTIEYLCILIKIVSCKDSILIFIFIFFYDLILYMSTSYGPVPYNKDTNTIFTWFDNLYTFPNNRTYQLLLTNIDNGLVYGHYSYTTPYFTSFLTFDNVSIPNASNGSYIAYVSGPDYNKSQTITVTCFVKGTNILSKNNEYVKIEDLKIGDEIKTFKNGYVKIKYILVRKMKNENAIHQIHKLKNENLFLTGGHSLLVDDLNESEKINILKTWGELKKVDDKFLLLTCFATNPNVIKIDDNNIYDLYHIVLENENEDGQYGIYSNNVLTESMSIKCYNNSIKYEINFV
jgi:hypothetical protein